MTPNDLCTLPARHDDACNGHPRPACCAPMPAPQSSNQETPKEWRCFHCGEVFTDREAAADHFGVQIDGTADEVACKLNATEGLLVKMLREAHEELRQYHQEDNAAFRQFYALGADHSTALRREEEKGYARGLEDAKKHPESIGLRSAVETPAPLLAEICALRGELELTVEHLEAANRACEEASKTIDAYRLKFGSLTDETAGKCPLPHDHFGACAPTPHRPDNADWVGRLRLWAQAAGATVVAETCTRLADLLQADAKTIVEQGQRIHALEARLTGETSPEPTGGLTIEETRFLAALAGVKPPKDSPGGRTQYGRSLIERVWTEYERLKASERSALKSTAPLPDRIMKLPDRIMKLPQ